MKGKNTIRLNERMMMEAMQLWVDSALTAKPRVTAVRQFQPTTYPEPGTPGFYEVDMDDGEKDEKKSPSTA